MNAGLLILAVFALQPLLLGLGLAGYWLRPRYPRAGLVLGIAAVAMVVIGAFVSLWTYIAAAVAGAAVGIGAIVRPRSPALARWLVVGGTAVWLLALILLLLDAGLA